MVSHETIWLTGSSLVDDITYREAAKAGESITSSAILGPFWRHDTPIRENGSTITFDTPADAQVVYMHGKVLCGSTGKPLANASVEAWQASTNGAFGFVVFSSKIFANGVIHQASMSSRIPSSVSITSVGSSSPIARETIHSTVSDQHHTQ